MIWRKAMPSFAVLGLMMALVMPPLAPAEAQMGFGRQWETNVDLSQADLTMIKATLDQKIHGQPAGVSATWSNAGTGNSGTITLMQIFARQGQRCERIDYQLVASGPPKASDRYEFVSCLQPGGAWKLAY